MGALWEEIEHLFMVARLQLQPGNDKIADPSGRTVLIPDEAAPCKQNILLLLSSLQSLIIHTCMYVYAHDIAIPDVSMGLSATGPMLLPVWSARLGLNALTTTQPLLPVRRLTTP